MPREVRVLPSWRRKPLLTLAPTPSHRDPAWREEKRGRGACQRPRYHPTGRRPPTTNTGEQNLRGHVFTGKRQEWRKNDAEAYEEGPSLPGRRDHTYNILYGEGWREDVNLWGSRARYAETLNAVVEDREEVVVTRAGHEPVVTVALDDYESRKGTAYLLRSPANARRLWESIERGGRSGRASPPA